MKNLELVVFDEKGQGTFNFEALELVTSKEFVKEIKFFLEGYKDTSKYTIKPTFYCSESIVSVFIVVRISGDYGIYISAGSMFKFYSGTKSVYTMNFNDGDIEMIKEVWG